MPVCQPVSGGWSWPDIGIDQYRLGVERYRAHTGRIDTSVRQHASMSISERGKAVLAGYLICKYPVCRYVSTPNEAGQCWLSIDTSAYASMPVCQHPRQGAVLGYCQYRYVAYVSISMSALERGSAVLARISICQYAGMLPVRQHPSEAGQCWLSIDTSVRQYASTSVNLSEAGVIATSIRRYNGVCQYVSTRARQGSVG
jgi:hypothetical protein